MSSTKTKIKARGNRQDVWDGKAKRTSGGLRKEDLIKNKRGKIVSKKMSESAKSRYPKLKAALCGSEQKEIEKEVVIPLKKEIEDEVVIPLKKEIKPKKAKTKKVVTKKVVTKAAPKTTPKAPRSEKLPADQKNLQFKFMSDLIYRLPEISQYQQLNLTHPERLEIAREMLVELIDLPFTSKYPNLAVNTLTRMLMQD